MALGLEHQTNHVHFALWAVGVLPLLQSASSALLAGFVRLEHWAVGCARTVQGAAQAVTFANFVQLASSALLWLRNAPIAQLDATVIPGVCVVKLANQGLGALTLPTFATTALLALTAGPKALVVVHVRWDAGAWRAQHLATLALRGPMWTCLMAVVSIVQPAT